jgi:hypothetical protein
MKKILIIIFILSLSDFYAQGKGNFHFGLNLNQDYRDNILLIDDSTRVKDFRFRSSFLFGYDGTIASINGEWGASYENRVQKYFNYNYYTRMEHLFNFHTSIPLNGKTLFYFNNDFKLRNYKNLKKNNYIRNILITYSAYSISPRLKLIFGYKNWIKGYPNILNIQNYLSHRPFLKLIYQLTATAFLGAKTEYQWQKGFLYPKLKSRISRGNLSGERYLVEIFGNTIFRKYFLIDFTYRFEYDVTDNINYQNSDNNGGDEELEDLLLEDPDYNYLKNQAAFSFLYRISPRLSFFSFIVLQKKNFTVWKINTNENTLRSDLLFYSSLFLKYKVLPNLKINLNYEYENRGSNLKKANYHRNTISLGLQYNF